MDSDNAKIIIASGWIHDHLGLVAAVVHAAIPNQHSSSQGADPPHAVQLNTAIARLYLANHLCSFIVGTTN